MYVGKQCLAGLETLAQSPASTSDARETPVAKATVATAPRDVCTLAMHKSVHTQEGIIFAYTSMCCHY